MGELHYANNTMDIASFRIYLRHAFRHLPWEFWLVIAVIALVIALVLRKLKGYSVYASIALGLTVFFGIYMLGAMVLKRIGIQIEQHPEPNLIAEYHRLFRGSAEHRAFMLFNVLVFMPFGFTLSEFLSVAKHFGPMRVLGFVALSAFLLSLSIETLQWTLRVGIFEFTDMVLNTLGAFLGAALAIVLRKLVTVSFQKNSHC